MTGGRRAYACLLSWTLAAALSTATVASAQGDTLREPLDRAAFTLNPAEYRVGPFQLGAGLPRGFQISTYVLPWLASPALGKAFPNFHTKWSVRLRDAWALSLRAGFYYANAGRLLGDADRASAFVLPFAATTSWVRPEATYSLQLTYVQVAADTDISKDQVTVRQGLLASNVQLLAALVKPLAPEWALGFTLRYLPYQQEAVGHSQSPIDDRTDADLTVVVSQEGIEHAVAGSVYASFRRGRLHATFGVGIGAYFIDGLGLVLPWRYPFPEFALFWRIGRGHRAAR